MPLSVDRAKFKSDFWFQHAVYEQLRAKAKRLTGDEWDLALSESRLKPAEFDALVILMFVYSWDNNGRFIDTVRWYEDHFEQVDRAFRRFGFNTASLLMPRALELYAMQEPYYAADLPLPADVEAETDRVNEAASADVSDERLTRAIVARAAEFDV